ncbi:MAG: serine/threonine protein kinase, partial [bacterium]|nr:serine/threonine protein kinase [bacterium]
IYSLGVCLYLMFTDQYPFTADNLDRLYQCHLRFKPEHPTTINRRCPKNLGDIIMKMLEKEPEDRYESCDQLRIVLSDVGRSRI